METINHEYHVSLEVAKLLKEAGFDWKIFDGYILYEDGGSFVTKFQTPHNFNGNNGKLFNNYLHHKEILSRPTLDVAQRWLREVHHLHITIFSSSQESWMFRITKPHQKLEDGVYGEDFYTFEEAQEAGEKKALELISEKGE